MRVDHWPILLLVAATAVGVTFLAPDIWLVLLTDGVLAAAVVAAAAGWGAWPASWLGFAGRGSGQQVCIATALGLGLLAVVTLILGVAGFLNRPVAWTLLAIGAVAGLARLYLAQGAQEGSPSFAQRDAGDARAPSFAQQRVAYFAVRALVPLLLAVPLAIALFGASLPPGILWQEEANGYDVLEYHLQGPREYYDAGRITFLPHNVYTSFPQQMEMLYLLLMHLAGGAYAGAIPAQLLHAYCGLLAVVALGCWTRPGWARQITILIAGSTPWLAHVGCLAYVENGMLFFAAVAAGLVVDYSRDKTDENWRAALTAGLCAGLAGGCKYTAVPLIAVGLVLAWLVTMRASLGQRARRIAVFVAGALLAFSPWAIRNISFTGNPVYPFAYEWLGGQAWSADQAQQWSVAHRVLPEYDSFAGRLALAAQELGGSLDDETRAFQPSLFGQVLFVLAVAGVVLGWSRRVLLLTIWAALILLGWISLTFIPGRFAMPLVVPLVLLAGGAVDPQRRIDRDRSVTTHTRLIRWKWPILLLALVGACANDLLLASRLRSHDRSWLRRTGVPLRMLLGQVDIFRSGHLLNDVLPTDTQIWLVGDAAVFYVERRMHYTVPFSRDPWIEFAAGGATPHECLNWLRSRNISHVVFSWAEIDRLGRTYGFAEVVTPQWVAELERAGFQRVEIEGEPADRAPVAIYRLPAAKTP